ncbi:MAG: palindromic element RPE1 domain-containing protein [Rickettsia endosymbiont of Ecitomorpha arachnoides]|nr:palindromic element RPE1 domain-containing protein [Rickettsia endosymbiont of Sceptobius lativentris]MCC8462660.1 palindromic element RPE1 domain-containing protein [Rickettsia endosymbiont of Ecitomorpha arachnoides]
MRPLRKQGFREEFEGDTEELATAPYKSVCEDSSTGLTYKLPLEVEFPKRSIEHNSTSFTINIANLINFKNL